MCIISEGLKESTGNRPDLPDCRSAAELAQAHQTQALDLLRKTMNEPETTPYGGGLVTVLIKRFNGSHTVEIECESMGLYFERDFCSDDYDSLAVAREWAAEQGQWIGNAALANAKFNESLRQTIRENREEADEIERTDSEAYRKFRNGGR